MPQLTISDQTFSRLQKYATPLVDTDDSAIAKLINMVEASQGGSALISNYGSGIKTDLSHTKVLSAEVSGRVLPKGDSTWKGILTEVVIQAASKLKDVNALSQLVVVNHVVGKKEGQGYEFIPKAGLSIQGQDANGAWRGVTNIAKKLQIEVRVDFMWYENEKASHPGETGRLGVGSQA